MPLSDDVPRSPRQTPELISVIIPARNAAATIDDQLAALDRQSYRGRWEVIIADNGSSDETNAKVRAWNDRLPDLRIIQASDRTGPNHARNVGTHAARGDFLLFCDADDRASPSWIEEMARAAVHDDLVGGALDMSALNSSSVREWVEPTQIERLPTVLHFMPYALSANLGIWSDVMTELGGWNESFDRPGGDDVDLCWRAQLSSYTLGFAKEAVMHYRYRKDLIGMARQHFRYGAAEPRLYRTFREHGFRRESPRAVFGNYLRAAKDIPYLLTRPHMRGIWVRKMAFMFGRIVGSVRNRVLFF